MVVMDTLKHHLLYVVSFTDETARWFLLTDLRQYRDNSLFSRKISVS